MFWLEIELEQTAGERDYCWLDYMSGSDFFHLTSFVVLNSHSAEVLQRTGALYWPLTLAYSSHVGKNNHIHSIREELNKLHLLWTVFLWAAATDMTPVLCPLVHACYMRVINACLRACLCWSIQRMPERSVWTLCSWLGPFLPSDVCVCVPVMNRALCSEHTAEPSSWFQCRAQAI